MRQDSAARALATGATSGVDLGDRFSQICLLDAAGSFKGMLDGTM
jgi:hypothetical protein